MAQLVQHEAAQASQGNRHDDAQQRRLHCSHGNAQLVVFKHFQHCCVCALCGIAAGVNVAVGATLCDNRE